MKQVEPRVFLIGFTVPNQDEVRRWLDHVGAHNYYPPEAASPAEQLVMLAAKRCYKSFDTSLNRNLTRIRTDTAEFIENILKVGHGSVCAHAVFNFAIEGLTRVCSAELNRHRIGWASDEADDVELAISEGSLRFVRFDDIEYWLPTSLRVEADDTDEVADKKLATQAVFRRAFGQAENNYRELEEIWADELAPASAFKAKKAITSMMRRVVPMGCSTGGCWSGGLRALRNVFLLRCAPEAEEEILLVANLMLEKMMAVEPNFFKDFEKKDGCWRPKYPKV